MKLDEDLGPDREDEFQTDDEENRAERACSEDDEDDSESDEIVPSRNPSGNETDIANPSWPQSYRQSMDMFTPPSISILRGPSMTGSGGWLSSCNRRQNDDLGFSLSKPLLSIKSIDKEEIPTSTLPPKVNVSSQPKLSLSESPPPQQKCSFAQAVLNGINVLCGVGLLTTPYAIKEGGWLSLLILLLFGIIACYTGILLKKCLESSPGIQTYPDIGEAAFGKIGRMIVAITLYLELYAACVEFLIMMSDNLTKVFPNVSINVAGMYLDAPQIFPILATLIVLPTVWLRDLSLLSYLSVGGVGASILVALCLLWVGTIDHIGLHPGGTALDLANLSVSFGIYGFCYSGHSVFPNIYTSMKKPSQFPLVLITSFVVCWFMYTGVAIFGFLIFGDSVQSQFTLNMPSELMASKIAVWTAVICPMTKYALTLTPVALSLEELIPSSRFRSHGASLFIRTSLVISTLVVARTVPLFGIMMALIGSLLAMLIALICPCVCYLSILRDRLNKLQIAVCIFTIIIGTVCACVGTYSSIARIAGQIA